MSDILTEIAAYTKERYKKTIPEHPLEEIKALALSMPKGNFEFEKALQGDEHSPISKSQRTTRRPGQVQYPVSPSQNGF